MHAGKHNENAKRKISHLSVIAEHEFPREFWNFVASVAANYIKGFSLFRVSFLDAIQKARFPSRTISLRIYRTR